MVDAPKAGLNGGRLETGGCVMLGGGLNRICRSLARMAILLAAIAVSTPLSALELATWESLAPSVEPYENPFDEMPREQIEDLRTILRADMAAEAGRAEVAGAEASKAARARLEAEGLDVAHLFAQREVVMSRRVEEATGVTQTYLGEEVLMDGFVLPLKAEAGRAVEFLLVPWVGGCRGTGR